MGIMFIQQNSSGTELVFLMVSSGDHVTPITGISPTVTLRKNNGSFASPSATVSEISKGWYKLSGTGLATDTNTVGFLLLNATGSGADPTDDRYCVVGFDPFTSNLGLSSIPSTGTIPTVGTGSNQISLNNGAVIIQTGTGSGQLTIDSGIVDSNTQKIKGTTAQGTAGYHSIDWTGTINQTGSVTLTNTTIGTVSLVSQVDDSGILSTSFEMPNVTGVANNIIDKIDQLHRRFFKKVDKTGSEIRTYADDGVTILTTQTYTSGGTEEVGAAT